MLTPLRHYTHAITEDDRRAAEKAAGLLAEALALGERLSQPVVRATVRATENGRWSEALSELVRQEGFEPPTR